MLTWKGERTLALELILGEAVQGLGSGGLGMGQRLSHGLCPPLRWDRRLVGEGTAVCGLTGSPLEGLVGHGWEPQGFNA